MRERGGAIPYKMENSSARLKLGSLSIHGRGERPRVGTLVVREIGSLVEVGNETGVLRLPAQRLASSLTGGWGNRHQRRWLASRSDQRPLPSIC